MSGNFSSAEIIYFAAFGCNNVSSFCANSIAVGAVRIDSVKSTGKEPHIIVGYFTGCFAGFHEYRENNTTVWHFKLTLVFLAGYRRY